MHRMYADMSHVVAFSCLPGSITTSSCCYWCFFGEIFGVFKEVNVSSSAAHHTAEILRSLGGASCLLCCFQHAGRASNNPIFTAKQCNKVCF